MEKSPEQIKEEKLMAARTLCLALEQINELCRRVNDGLVDASHPTEEEKERHGGEGVLSKERMDIIAIVTRFRVIKENLDEIHHMLGHMLVDRCWRNVDYGDEFTPEGEPQSSKLSEILDKIHEVVEKSGFELEGATMFSLDDLNIQDDIPEDVKAEIRKIVKQKPLPEQ